MMDDAFNDINVDFTRWDTMIMEDSKPTLDSEEHLDQNFMANVHAQAQADFQFLYNVLATIVEEIALTLQRDKPILYHISILLCPHNWSAHHMLDAKFGLESHLVE